MIFKTKNVSIEKSKCIQLIESEISKKNPDISIKTSFDNGVEFQTMILVNVDNKSFTCFFRRGKYSIRYHIDERVQEFDLTSFKFQQIYERCISKGIVPEEVHINKSSYPKPATNSKRFSAARH